MKRLIGHSTCRTFDATARVSLLHQLFSLGFSKCIIATGTITQSLNATKLVLFRMPGSTNVVAKEETTRLVPRLGYGLRIERVSGIERCSRRGGFFFIEMVSACGARVSWLTVAR